MSEERRRLTKHERHQALELVAKIETALMVEFLSDERPDWKEATWVANVPWGPRGVPDLQKFLDEYGSPHVTTGNAKPLSPTEVGVYVREDVLERSSNPVRDYFREGA